MHTCIALCSDSTFTNCAGSSPEATKSASFSTTVVCGVIGYAEITWTRASFAAYDCAEFPDRTARGISALLHHLDREGLAFLRADPAPLAVIEEDDGPALFVDPDRDVRTELPAHVAFRARLEVDDRAEGPPARGLDHVARHGGHGDLRQIFFRLVRVHAATFSRIRTRS